MNKHRILLRTLGALAFCALLAAAVAFATFAVERKASRIKYDPFFEAPQDFDVLFYGDSHAVNAIYPMELWRDYGIAAYNLSGVGNMVPMSYWTMMNTLDLTHPELVVIDVNDVEFDSLLTSCSGNVHTVFDALPLTRMKIAALEDLMDGNDMLDDDLVSYDDQKWEYYFTLGKYHSRWNEVTLDELFYEPSRQKGGEMAQNVAVPNDYNIIDENDYAYEDGVGYAYLRRMIEECQSREIDVLLTHVPFPSTEEDQRAANAVYWIAQEYGVDYIDFVYLDQVVDYRTDCFDSYSHMNASGARKVTDYIGDYICVYFDVPDRREDPAYAHWHEDYADYLDYKVTRLEIEGELSNVLAMLHDTSFSARISIAPGAALYQNESQMRLMQNIAREHIYDADMFVKWSDGLFPLGMLEQAAASGEAYFVHLGGAQRFVEEASGEAAAELSARHFPDAGDAEVCIEVIDALTGETAAQLRF